MEIVSYNNTLIKDNLLVKEAQLNAWAYIESCDIHILFVVMNGLARSFIIRFIGSVFWYQTTILKIRL